MRTKVTGGPVRWLAASTLAKNTRDRHGGGSGHPRPLHRARPPSGPSPLPARRRFGRSPRALTVLTAATAGPHARLPLHTRAPALSGRPAKRSACRKGERGPRGSVAKGGGGFARGCPGVVSHPAFTSSYLPLVAFSYLASTLKRVKLSRVARAGPWVNG